MKSIIALISISFLALLSTSVAADTSWIEATRAEYEVPALGVLVLDAGEVDVFEVTGERKAGSGIAVEKGDLWHIGSNTKSMTATVIARLVERGDLSFDTTIGEVFSDFSEEIHPIYRQVTVTQLLSHQAGMKPNPGALAFFGYFLSEKSLMEQRVEVVKTMTGEKPEYEPGTQFLYSNAGYIVAGAMAEHVTGKSWEKLIKEEVFDPLSITTFGFGPPGSRDKVEQPWGHKDRTFWFGRRPMNPGPQADNPPVLGPAGTVHMSLEDYGRYALDQLKGEKGDGALLTQETYQYLHQGHRQIDDNASYALGWGVSEIDGTGLRMLGHSGSNTMWYARIELIPERDLVFLMVANDGTDKGKSALRDVRNRLHDTYLMPLPGGNEGDQ